MKINEDQTFRQDARVKRAICPIKGQMDKIRDGAAHYPDITKNFIFLLFYFTKQPKNSQNEITDE